MIFLILFPLLAFVVAIPSNLFSFITLRRQTCLRNGIGYYLLSLTLINQISLAFLAARLIHLTLIMSGFQSSGKLNDIFCKLVSYLLTCFSRLTYWLGLFVTLERVYTTIFLSKRWFKQPHIARRLLVLTTIVVFLSTAYELFFMKSLFISQDGNIAMCIPLFPTEHQSMWVFIHQFVSISHFVVPLLINIGCTGIILWIVIKTKMNIRVQYQCEYFVQNMKKFFK